MSKIWIREVGKASKLEILGHEFNGLTDIKKAVESYCRVGGDPWDTESKSKIEGIHVVCIYEPYPCFDSEDYANENRDFSNYFFSTEPFTKEQIARLSRLPGRCNAQMVSDTMPEWALPAIYYRGEGGKLILATL